MQHWPDPRIHAWRKDRAAASLKGRVNVPLFVEGATFQVRLGHVALRKAPDNAAALVSELLFGEDFVVYDDGSDQDWVWGQSGQDGYVGYCWAEPLSEHRAEATHRVTAAGAFLFPSPDFRVPPFDYLTFGARVAIEEEQGDYARLAHGGWAYRKMLAPLAKTEPDFVAVAERFIGVPYLWGGRSPHGFDCSGLVQIALDAAGIAAPRDSDMQETALGKALPDRPALKRGDLIFTKGHVAIVSSATDIVHANAFHMSVTREPLAGFLGRGNKITSIRRLV